MFKTIFKVLLAAAASIFLIATALSSQTGVSILLSSTVLFGAVIVGAFKIIPRVLYRPEENHLGVLYRMGRFHRLVNPDEVILLLPWIDRIHHEVSLYTRTAEFPLINVELGDGLAVDLRFKVFFHTDLRQATPEKLTQVLRFEGMEWAGMIRTSTEDIVRNQVFLDIDHTAMNRLRKDRGIKRMLSSELAGRMRSFGILINEENGVMLAEAQPNKAYFDAVQKRKAAAPIGSAALERLRPILDALKHMRHEDARAALLLEFASKILEVDELPEILVSPPEEYPAATVASRENRRSSDALRQLRSGRVRDYPLAE